MKTLLIPGYATQLRASIFRAPLPRHEGFFAFQSAVDAGDTDVFHWGISRCFSFLQSLNPFSYLKLYRDEETLAHSLETQQRLFDMIAASGTERIICHSMGCRLLLNTINSLGLPSSVRSIVFLQADIDAHATVDLPKNVSIKNYHCFWDQSLFASSVVHQNIRIGMCGWKHINVENHFYALLKPMNLHTSPMRDEKLANDLCRNIIQHSSRAS